MQLRHVNTVAPAVGGPQRVTAVAWSPNGKRLAVVTTERVVYMYDEDGVRKDKFATKGSNAKAPKTYTVVGMAFSPDSTRLAIAQSDQIVFVYKIGENWGDKKTICNKFAQSDTVTCLTWPQEQPNEVVFGLADGKVRAGSLRSNKNSTLYSADSYTVSVCSSPDGHSILTGHLDKAIYRFTFEDGNLPAVTSKLCTHSAVPQVLAWGENIVAGGEDKILTFYDVDDGRVVQRFDDSRNPGEYPYSVAAFNPSGTTVVCGGFNKLRVLNFSVRRQKWEEDGTRDVDNLYSATALCWNGDGSRVAVGSFCGQLDVFDACLRRSVHNGKFELTHVSESQVIVKRINVRDEEPPPPVLLRSVSGEEITKVNIFKDRYVVAHTPVTLLLADLDMYLMSEIHWSGSGNEKFYFEQPQACCIFNAEELTLVEYGKNEILGTCRTAFTNPHLNSIRIYTPYDGGQTTKRCAYLATAKTVQITDLDTNATLVSLEHDAKVDWLELNRHGNYLLFRDKRRRLYLLNAETQARTILLDFCSYVQWVPLSDVIVAQNRNKLCVWYSIESPDQVSTFAIKGEISGILREDGRTQVTVDEGLRTKSYTLDESLIEFGAAMDDRDYNRAISMLETVEQTPETEAMWAALSVLALEDRQLLIAERCFAGLGDVAKAAYLRRVRGSVAAKERELGMDDGRDHYSVKAELLVLERRFRQAEIVYLEQGAVVECMTMYQSLQKFEDAVRVAAANNYPDLEAYKNSYLQWLADTKQYEKAAVVKENEGDYPQAINLYLKGNLPARAAQLVTSYSLQLPTDILERIAGALLQAGMYSKAGDFFEKLGVVERAFEAYRKGNDFKRAVALAQAAYPNQVIQLEEEWGDYLVSQKQYASAIFHYGNVNKLEKALEAALLARQFNTATDILKLLDPNVAAPYYSKLAVQFESSHNFAAAEQLYLMSNMPSAAVEMYAKVNRWQDIERLVEYLSPEEATRLYVAQAETMQGKGKLKEAEKLYCAAKLPNLAISMYKAAGNYDDVMRLVSTYDKANADATFHEIAQVLEREGRYKEAEKFYVQSKDWQGAIEMLRANNMWEDAYAVATAHGSQEAADQVAYSWCRSGSVSSSVMNKMGLVKPAVRCALNIADFDFAYKVAEKADKSLLPIIHFKHAEALEDTFHFKEAEEHFVSAGKPREAINMYMHDQDWANAARVAREHDRDALTDIQIAQARGMMDNEEFAQAEQVLLRIERPAEAVRMYKERGMWDDALRVARKYDPNRLPTVQAEYERSLNADTHTNKDDLLKAGRMWVEQGDYSRAIDAFLKITKDATTDYDWLEEVWEGNLVQLAWKFVPERLPEVVQTVAQRLLEINRVEAAAEMYAGVEMFKEAIDVYLRAGMFQNAESLCQRRAPEFGEYVEAARVSSMVEAGNGAELEAAGHVRKALEAYARSNEWEACIELASKQGGELLNTYETMYAERLVSAGDYAAAVKLYAKYGAAAVPNNFNLYKRIVLDVLYRREGDLLFELRTFLFGLYSAIRNNGINDPMVGEFERFLVIAHLLFVQAKADEAGLGDTATKLSVSLCRYAGDIPADKAFYTAGQRCARAGSESLALILMERYTDIVDVMAGTGNEVQNRYFEGTDVPVDVQLPEEPYLDGAAVEEARNWVIEKSLENSAGLSLPTRPCDNCNTAIYVASLWCFSCKQEYVPCIVTGFPVVAASRMQCGNCGMAANKEDWNQYVIKNKSCPWCNTQQSLAS